MRFLFGPLFSLVPAPPFLKARLFGLLPLHQFTKIRRLLLQKFLLHSSAHLLLRRPHQHSILLVKVRPWYSIEQVSYTVTFPRAMNFPHVAAINPYIHFLGPEAATSPLSCPPHAVKTVTPADRGKAVINAFDFFFSKFGSRFAEPNPTRPHSQPGPHFTWPNAHKPNPTPASFWPT
jgi:hypothetical protein